MRHKQFTLRAGLAGSLVVGAVLTALTAFIAPAAAQTPPRAPLPLGAATQVAQKEARAKASGVPRLTDAQARQAAQGAQPGRGRVETARTTKAEALARWQEAAARSLPYIQSLERDSGPQAAQRVRDELEAQRRQLEALPDGPIQVLVPVSEVGRHSITYGTFTYDMGFNQKDGFYRVGSAWDVQYDLINWTSRRWKLTDCGGVQQEYIVDAGHTGGQDGWRQMDYLLEAPLNRHAEPD